MAATHPDIDFANELDVPCDIHLISCGMLKTADPAKARDLYTSSTFQQALAFASGRASLTGTGPALCLIVSARHGLLDLDEVVAPYDESLKNMTPVEIEEWAALVTRQIAALGIVRANFHVHAGAAYMEALAPALAPFGRVVNFFNPWKAKGVGQIGQRRGFYSRTAKAESEAKLTA